MVADIPKGWVQCDCKCPGTWQQEATHALLPSGKVYAIHYGRGYDSEIDILYNGKLRILKDYWEDFGIIPIKKAPKPEPREIVRDIEAVFPGYDFTITMPPEWSNVKCVRVTEILEDDVDLQKQIKAKIDEQDRAWIGKQRIAQMPLKATEDEE